MVPKARGFCEKRTQKLCREFFAQIFRARVNQSRQSKAVPQCDEESTRPRIYPRALFHFAFRHAFSITAVKL